ncbi:MAG: hydrogen gas-evolving membrane-bound hydrogenase subunit E [Solirubrobacteraceae bacterium]
MRRARLIVGGLGLLMVTGGLVWAGTGLQHFGHVHSRYGTHLAHAAVPQRAATNSVVAIAFDYRGFDTLGEEFILFISVVGVMVLLRAIRGDADPRKGVVQAETRQASDSSRWLGAAIVGPLSVLAAYVIVHGQLTPGGGFQGGVVLMAALAFVGLGGEYLLLLRLRRSATLPELADAAGAAGFVVIGLGGLISAGVFFQNFLPKGSPGNLLSGGMIPLANISVGLEVAGAVLMVLSELLDQRLMGARR